MSRNKSFTCLCVFWTLFSLVECSLEFVFKQARSIKSERTTSNVNESVVIGQGASCRVRHVTHITKLTAINLRTNSYIKAASVAQFRRLFFTVYIWTSAFKIKLVSSQSEPHVHRPACNICAQLNSSIAGLHVTSRRPCWWSRTKSFLSSGNFEEKYYCIDPQNGHLVKWLQTKNKYTNSFTRATKNARMFRLCKEFTQFILWNWILCPSLALSDSYS